MTFSKSKLMLFPRHVLIGHKVVDKLGTLVGDLELGPQALLVADETTKRIAGDRVAKILRSLDHRVDFALVKGASMPSVEAVRKQAKEVGAKYLLGVGGGSVIDVAKLAAFELRVPYLSVPTSAAHDGIASARASIKETRGNVSKTAKPPEAIVADTHLIAQAPFRMLASGCGDVLANLVAIKDWELASALKGEEYSSIAAALSEQSAGLVLQNAPAIKPGLEESVWLVVKALIMSGVSMSVAGNSRPASGSEHLFSHMLDRLAPGKALHGEQCGVGTIMMMKLHHGSWERIRDTLKAIGAPSTAKELGIPAKTVVEALMGAHKVNLQRYTILGETGLTREAATQLAKETGVI